ncbi:MAG: phosphatidate cytidylyltransferase [Solirubrobacterales bacterium]
MTSAENRTAAAGGGLADLPQRIAIALPAAAVAISAVVLGGVVFAGFLAVIGVLAAREAYLLLSAPGVDAPAGEPSAGHRVGAVAAALVWVGVPLVLAVALREHEHGIGLVIDVMLAVFVGDTAAHILGSTVGRRVLAPRISPRKTIEGLTAGIIFGTAAVLIAGSFQPWLGTVEALALGLAVSLAAPAGDLFESAVKRRAGLKDSGRMLGAHGGFLDRVDAVLFGAVAGYCVSIALV